jgi:hypothetical protein
MLLGGELRSGCPIGARAGQLCSALWVVASATQLFRGCRVTTDNTAALELLLGTAGALQLPPPPPLRLLLLLLLLLACFHAQQD